MADGGVATATRPRSSGEAVYLPPLPESQIVRPPTQDGLRPGQQARVQVSDDYFVLPRIDAPSKVAEDSQPPLRPAVTLRAPGAKVSKAADDPDDASVGQASFQDSRQKESGADKAAGTDAIRTTGERESGDSGTVAKDSQETLSRHHEPATDTYPASSRASLVGVDRKPHARRGPLPSQRRQANAAATQDLAGTGGHGRPRTGASNGGVGKAGSMTGSGGRVDTVALEGGLGEEVSEQAVEERLERIRSSNIRRDFRSDTQAPPPALRRGGDDSEVIQGVRATSPRRPRPADDEYGRTAGFGEKPPDMLLERARRRGGGGGEGGREGKGAGEECGGEEVQAAAVRAHLRQTLLAFLDQSAPHLDTKPPPALSVEAGPAAKSKDTDSAPQPATGSDDVPRGRHGEGRKTWYGTEGSRADVARLPAGGPAGGAECSEVRLQPAVAHGVDVGFERTMGTCLERSKGRALEDKDPSLDNLHTPSGGYLPSYPDKTRHPGSDGSRAQARAEVAVAAAVKLPRQEGFMVDRDKDLGLPVDRADAHRADASRDQAITSTDDVTEELAAAAKLRRLLDGPGKLEDTDYERLDGRASQQTHKVRERRGHYGVPKHTGGDEERDARPIPQELQLKPPAFDRRKGSGEDKMRSAYY